MCRSVDSAQASPTQQTHAWKEIRGRDATDPSYGADSMIEASVSANGASPVDSPFEPIQKPSIAVSFSP